MSASDPKRTLVSVRQAALQVPPAHFQFTNLTRYNALSAAKPPDQRAVMRQRTSAIAAVPLLVKELSPTRELDQALLRKTANSEILRLISTSPGDLDLVFSTILEHATRICNANFGTLFRFDGENLHPAAIDLTGTGLSY